MQNPVDADLRPGAEALAVFRPTACKTAIFKLFHQTVGLHQPGSETTSMVSQFTNSCLSTNCEPSVRGCFADRHELYTIDLSLPGKELANSLSDKQLRLFHRPLVCTNRVLEQPQLQSVIPGIRRMFGNKTGDGDVQEAGCLLDIPGICSRCIETVRKCRIKKTVRTRF